MSMLPWLLPPWASLIVVGAMLVLLVARVALGIATVLRWLPVELRLAVINWRVLVQELRSEDGRDSQ